MNTDGVKLSGDKTKNGAQQAPLDDIDNLINTLKEMEESLGKKAPITDNPKPNDLKSSVGNLSISVPTGFLLLHRDLEEILKTLKGDSSSTSSSGGKDGVMSFISGLGPGGAVALGSAVGSFAGGALSGVFSAMKPDSPGQKNISEIIDQLNASLTVDDIKDDPDVLASQHTGIVAYIKAYFAAQASGMVGKEFINGVLTGIGSGLRDGVKALLGFPRDVSPIDRVVNDVMATIKSSDYINDTEVEESKKLGVISYIKVYFAAQVAKMATTGFADALGSAPGTFVNSVFTTMFGIEKPDPFKAVINDILDQIKSSDYINDTEVLDAERKGIISYLKVYFTTQVTKMAATGFADTLGSIPGTFVNSVFTTMFGVEKPDPFKAVINDILDSIKSADYINDPDVLEEEKKGIVAYLKTYFISQTVSDSFKTVAGGVGEGLGTAVNSFFKAMFNKSEEKTDPIKNVVSDILDSIKSSDYINDPDVIEAEKSGIVGYLKTYFISQTASESFKNVAGGVGDGLGTAVNSFFKAMFNKSEEKTGPIQNVVSDILDSIKSSDYINDPDVLDAEKTGVINYLKTYFVSQTASDNFKTVAGGVSEGLGGAVNSYFKAMFGKTEEKTDPIKNVVSDILDSIKSSDYINDKDVLDAEKTGIVNYLKTYFIAQTASDTFKTAASGTAEGVAGAVKSFFKTMFNKTDEKTVSPIQNVISDILSSIKSSDYINDPDVIGAEKKGIVDYVKTYFDAQSKSILIKDTADAIGSAASGSVKSFFSNIFGKTEKSESVVQNIIESLLNDIDVEEVKKSEGIKDAVDNGVIDSVKAYFESQSKGIAAETKGSSTGTAIAEGVKSFISGLFGKKNKKNKTLPETYSEMIGSIVSDSLDSISADTYKGSSLIASTRDEGISLSIKSTLNALSSNFVDSIQKDSAIFTSDQRKLLGEKFVVSVGNVIDGIGGTSSKSTSFDYTSGNDTSINGLISDKVEASISSIQENIQILNSYMLTISRNFNIKLSDVNKNSTTEVINMVENSTTGVPQLDKTPV